MESCWLPDDIIDRIISNPTFTNKHVIQLSLVCKEFLRAVQRRPVLVFDWINDHHFLDKVLEYIISTLTRYDKDSIHLHTLKLSFAFQDHRTLMDQCIQLATAKNLGLRNLELRMPLIRSYFLTQSIFRAESLVQLDMNLCRLQEPESMVITWPNLKRLRLNQVHMEERVFENIIRNCSLIEVLEIVSSCPNISKFDFKAFNLGYLNKLEICFCKNQGFEMGTTAPNLECLALTASNLGFDLGECGYPKLKSLSLSLTADLNGDSPINFAHQFPVLGELHIHRLFFDEDKENKAAADEYATPHLLNISTPSLKKIKRVIFREHY